MIEDTVKKMEEFCRICDHSIEGESGCEIYKLMDRLARVNGNCCSSGSIGGKQLGFVYLESITTAGPDRRRYARRGSKEEDAKLCWAFNTGEGLEDYEIKF